MRALQAIRKWSYENDCYYWICLDIFSQSSYQIGYGSMIVENGRKYGARVMDMVTSYHQYMHFRSQEMWTDILHLRNLSAVNSEYTTPGQSLGKYWISILTFLEFYRVSCFVDISIGQYMSALWAKQIYWKWQRIYFSWK